VSFQDRSIVALLLLLLAAEVAELRHPLLAILPASAAAAILFNLIWEEFL